MYSYPKVILTPSGDWEPSDMDDDVQWGDSDYDVSSGANVSDTSYTQSNDILNPILS